MNDPVVDFAPLSVLLSEVVGVPVVFQQTPCAVGFDEPSAVTFPFPIVVVVVILETAWVVTVGGVLAVKAQMEFRLQYQLTRHLWELLQRSLYDKILQSLHHHGLLIPKFPIQ